MVIRTRVQCGGGKGSSYFSSFLHFLCFIRIGGRLRPLAFLISPHPFRFQVLPWQIAISGKLCWELAHIGRTARESWRCDRPFCSWARGMASRSTLGITSSCLCLRGVRCQLRPPVAVCLRGAAPGAAPQGRIRGGCGSPDLDGGPAAGMRRETLRSAHKRAFHQGPHHGLT
jgi:hypothetical protein